MMPPQDENKFKASIDVETPRKFTPEFACGIAFYGTVLVQICLSFAIFGSKTSEVLAAGETACPSGMSPASLCGRTSTGVKVTNAYNLCVDEGLCKELQQCVTGRRLQMGEESGPLELPMGFDEHLRRLAFEDEAATPLQMHHRNMARRRLDVKSNIAEDTWEFLAEHAYQPTVLFMSAFICAGIWLFGIKKMPRVIVWGTLIADTLMFIVVFLWYLIDFEIINVFCLVAAAAMVIAMIVLRKQIDGSCVIFKTAVTGFSENIRLVAVTFAVQAVWIGFFALWIAALIDMNFIHTAVKDGDSFAGWCKLEKAGWVNNRGIEFFWMITYYWATYFARNVNLMMITANVSGWFFQQPGYESFWIPALKWSLGPQAGGNAGCAFLMGIARYLLDRVGSVWNIVFSVLNPFHWVALCLALLLKTVMQTYTKYGLIVHTLSGKPFCESAQQGFALLKNRLGDALLCDYIGSRIMAWVTYFISVGVAFAAWSWADEVQGVEVLSEIDASALMFLVCFYAWILSYPLIVLVTIVLVEANLDISSENAELRAVCNSIFASLFMGAVTLFILTFVSQLVVSACDVIFVCFAIEADLQQQEQERFSDLYKSIKETAGVVDGNGVVMGTAPPGVVQAQTVPGPAPVPAQVVGNVV